MTKKVTTPKFLNIARYAAHAGVTRQSISQMIDRGQLKVARRKGREKLLNVREADLAREQNRLRDSTTPSVLTARMGQIGSELALKLERLSRVKASLTFSAAAGVGARVLADVLLPRLTVDDQLVDLVLEAGDASRTRAALIVWTRNVLQAAVVGLEARAREYAEEAPPALAQVTVGDDTGAPVTLASLRAELAMVEDQQKQLRLARLRGELVDRTESFNNAEELGRKVRARIGQLAGLSVELADCARAGRAALQARLGAALGLIAADLRAMLDPASGKGAAA